MLTEPSVSTEGRRLIIAWIFTIRDTLRARTMVTTAGSPSGTAATAKEIAVISISGIFLFCISAMPKSRIHKTMARILKSLPRSARRFCKGVVWVSVWLIEWAILPIWVFIPVAITMPSPLPLITLVDINAILMASPGDKGLSATKSGFFSTGTDSPVSAASSIRRLLA